MVSAQLPLENARWHDLLKPFCKVEGLRVDTTLWHLSLVLSLNNNRLSLEILPEVGNLKDLVIGWHSMGLSPCSGIQGSTLSSTGMLLFCSPTVRPVSKKRRGTRVMGRKMRSRKTMRESLNWGLNVER